MQEITFTYNGKRYSAPEGFTVAEALIHNRIYVISRSIKYHRPRGYFCGKGQCSHCMVEIDGVSNVRSCVTLLKDGMAIRSQNYVLSVNHDLLRVADYMFKPYFDYSRMGTGKGIVSKIFNKFVRRFAGYGRLPAGGSVKRSEEIGTDVLVIGGGAAGMESATVSAEFGARVVLVDARNPYTADPRVKAMEGRNRLAVMPWTVAVSIEKKESGFKVVAYKGDEQLAVITVRSIIMATGTEPSLPVFENNDMPGIITHDAFEMLVDKAVAITYPVAVEVTKNIPAKLLEKLSVSGKQVYIVKSRDVKADLSKYGNVIEGGIVKALGKNRVKAVLLDSGRKLSVNFIAVDPRAHLSTSLLFQINAKMEYIENFGYVPIFDEYMESSVKGIFVSGSLAWNLADPVKEAKIAGINSAVYSVSAPFDRKKHDAELNVAKKSQNFGKFGDRTFVCTCEDIIYRELEDYIKKGYTTAEKLKRTAGISTGVCQGKLCMQRSIQMLKGKGLPGEMTTQRPPFSPVKMGSLAKNGGNGNEKI